MTKVTYLIGAGASFHALPIVSNWNERLREFIKYLKENEASFEKEGLTPEQISEVVEDIKSFFPQAEKHATIDTYAKKLFLKNNAESQRKLTSLKHFIGCFFSFEQTVRNHYVPQFEDLKEIIEVSDFYKGQKTQVDPRYDVFFATLLKSDTKSLDERVNIISWNYDLQLELAYKDYYEKEHPHQSLKIFPSAYLPLYTERITPPPPKIVKLNGTAGLFKHPYEQPQAENPKEENKIQTDTDFQVPSLETLLIRYSNYLSGNSNSQPLIYFAWEKTDVSVKAIDYAKEIIKETKTLVIIGYSFPNFNREVDKELLSYLDNECKIYIQDLEDKVEGLKQRLKGLLLNAGRDYEIETYTDLDQFFIPYEL